MDNTPVDKGAKIAELRRELAFREAVYPGQIRAGRLAKWRAQRQFYVMKCILHDYTGADAIKAPLNRWLCPVCENINFTPLGHEVVRCNQDGKHPTFCGNGPFVLLAERTNRKLATDVAYTAYKIEGCDYPHQAQLLDL